MNTVYQLQQSLYPSNIPFQVLIKVICIVQKVLIDLASRASLLVAFQNIVTIRTLHYVLQILIFSLSVPPYRCPGPTGQMHTLHIWSAISGRMYYYKSAQNDRIPPGRTAHSSSNTLHNDFLPRPHLPLFFFLLQPFQVNTLLSLIPIKFSHRKS